MPSLPAGGAHGGEVQDEDEGVTGLARTFREKGPETNLRGKMNMYLTIYTHGQLFRLMLCLFFTRDP